MCRGGRVHSSIALEHFLGEGGGGEVWVVTAAAVIPLCQRLLTSVKVQKSHLGFLWKMQILVLSIWGRSQIILMQSARDQKHLEG